MDQNPTLPFDEARYKATEAESVHVTGDGKMVEMRFSIHYRVTDPIAYLTRSTDINEIVRDAGTSAGISVSATRPLADLYTLGRDDAEASLRAQIAEILAPYDLGIAIERVNLTFVHAPQEVHADFRDYASALHNRETMIHQAQEQAAKARYVAEASATSILAAASGAYAMETRTALGRAEALSLEGRAYERNPQFNELRLRMGLVSRNLAGKKKVYISPFVDPNRFNLIIVPPGQAPEQRARDYARDEEATEPFGQMDRGQLQRIQGLAPNR